MMTLTLFLQDAAKWDWPKIVGAVVVIIAAAVTGGGVVWTAVKKVRENARKAKTLEVAERDAAVAAAVEKKRLEMQAVIDRAQQTAELAQQATQNWQAMAELAEAGKTRADDIHREEMAAVRLSMERLREERNAALEELSLSKAKVEQVVDFNLGLQGKVQENANEIKKLREEMASK
jgi:Na+/phosphate symporter